MAFAEHYQTPDLASVLQTLAAFAPPRPFTPQPAPPDFQQPVPDDELEEGEYDPSDFQPINHSTSYLPQVPYSQHQTLQAHQSTYQYPPDIRDPYQPQSSSTVSLTQPPQQSQSQTTQSSKPKPDHSAAQKEKASQITTYPPALRLTTSLLSSSPTTTDRIKHLIGTAHTHERQWWVGRQDLVKRLAGREEARAKLSSVLASVSGTVGASDGKQVKPGNDEEARKELRLYDRKVHKAYTEMVTATQRELKSLGIPFFCIRDDLVVRGDVQEGSGEMEKGKVTEKELGKLQAKVVELLEDLVQE
ncbi:MAG: hypothetical protein Q9218_007330 [Villophora microphyllina]